MTEINIKFLLNHTQKLENVEKQDIDFDKCEKLPSWRYWFLLIPHVIGKYSKFQTHVLECHTRKLELAHILYMIQFIWYRLNSAKFKYGIKMVPRNILFTPLSARECLLLQLQQIYGRQSAIYHRFSSHNDSLIYHCIKIL